MRVCLDDEMCAFIMFILLDICWYVPGIPNKLSSMARTSARSTVWISSPSFGAPSLVGEFKNFTKEYSTLPFSLRSGLAFPIWWPKLPTGMREASRPNIFNIWYRIIDIFTCRFFFLFTLFHVFDAHSKGKAGRWDDGMSVHAWYRPVLERNG